MANQLPSVSYAPKEDFEFQHFFKHLFQTMYMLLQELTYF
jgi:hypothetical protein